MKCETFALAGGAVAIVCSDRRARPPCVGCGAEGTKLCDYALAGRATGRTCDRRICAKCTVPQPQLGSDRDYCPAHAELARKPREKAAALQVFTARISTRDPDRLDITRKSAGPEGIVFAPSWAIVRPYLDVRARADALRKGATFADKQGQSRTGDDLRRQAGDLDNELERLWSAYVPAYIAEMRASYRAERSRWEALLARERAVLACFCTNAERCHRTLLARDILPKLGAAYGGEVA